MITFDLDTDDDYYGGMDEYELLAQWGLEGKTEL